MTSYCADDTVRAKLSSLTETQDSIVNVAQWLLFHKRHAVRVAELWLARVNEAPPAKRLSLIYLANEVVQQSKARKKLDFLIAFEPIIAEGTANAYKSVPLDVQHKIRRVVEVWRQRGIFEDRVQMEIETKVDEVDRNRASKRSGIASSLFSSANGLAAPPQFAAIIKSHTSLSQAETKSGESIATFTKTQSEIQANDSGAHPLSIKAVHLGTLLRSLNDVEVAVAESITARQELLAGLEKLVATHKESLKQEDHQARQFQAQRQTLEDDRKHVEELIVRGIADADTPAKMEPPRPDAEPLTPPPAEVESLMPLESSSIACSDALHTNFAEIMPAETADPPLVAMKHPVQIDMGTPSDDDTNLPASKKRKLDGPQTATPQGDFMGQLDPDVEQLLQ